MRLFRADPSLQILVRLVTICPNGRINDNLLRFDVIDPKAILQYDHGFALSMTSPSEAIQDFLDRNPGVHKPPRFFADGLQIQDHSAATFPSSCTTLSI